MGRLSGIKYRVCVKKLKKLGFRLHRKTSGSHEAWRNDEKKTKTTIPKHGGDIPEGTLRAILKQAEIEIDVFLSV